MKWSFMKWSFMKWSLVKITLKHNLDLFILSFETMNPDLHYIPKKSILIEPGHLDWRGFSLRGFYNQQGCCLFSSAKILNKSFTCSGWIFKCIIGQSEMKKENKNVTIGWKPEKGSLERKWENFQRLTGRTSKRMKSQQPRSIWSLHGFLNPFQN